MPTTIPPEGDLSPYNSITPGRQTRAVFDITETVQIEEGVNIVRMGRDVGQIANRDNADASRFHEHTRAWTSGIVTLAIRQEGSFQEEVPKVPFVYVPPGGVNVVSLLAALAVNVVSVAIWKQNPGRGITYNEGVAESGADVFYQREVPDYMDWDAGLLPLTAPMEALYAALPKQTIKQGCILHAQELQRADQGYCVRFCPLGTDATVPDTVGIFYFGGTEGGTLPQYALVFEGSGSAKLWEYGQKASGGAYSWGLRSSFQFARPGEVVGKYHQIIIYPVLGPHGEKFIHFAGVNLDTNETNSAGVGSVGNTAGTGAGASAMSERFYKWTPAIAGTVDGSPGHATGAGRWYLTERIDNRYIWQISKISFYTSGTLTDAPVDLPAIQSARAFVYNEIATVPLTTDTDNPVTLTHQLKRADTGAEITMSGGTPPPTGVYVDWNFTGDGNQTPVLFGYHLRLPPVNQTITPGKFECPLISANITGDEGNAQNDSAICSIVDILDKYPRLRKRGELSFRIQTKVAPIDENTDTFPVILFRGTVGRPHGTKRGKPYAPNGGAGRIFPNWYDYQITAGGMWLRLEQKSLRTFTTLAHFADDRFGPRTDDLPLPSAETSIVPWRVTDAIVYLLQLAGFPETMIRITDNPIRLYQGIVTPPSDLTVDYNTSAQQLILRFCRAYLGLFLHFAPNDGPLQEDGLPCGQWILIGPPKASAPAVWNFVSGPGAENFVNGLEGGKAGTGTRLWHLPGAYAAKTTATQSDLEEYPIPPEGNAVTFQTAPDEVKTGGIKISNTMVNPYSFKAPGSSITPNADSPHYLGRLRPIILGDPTLWGGGDVDGLKKTQKAIDFMVRRVFNVACLPRRLKPIYAPLVIILDPETKRRRPLRFYDKVTWNGQEGWYVRNCNPEIKRDSMQMAYYELERTIPLNKTS